MAVQTLYPAAQVSLHALPVHVAPGEQAFPHMPQLLLSSLTSAQ